MARRTMAAWRAGSGHTLVAPKLHRSGERRGKHTRRGRLRLSIHWWPSNHTGAENGVAFDGDWAGWEQPWRCGLPKLVRLESGVAHTQTVAGWEQPFTVRSQSCVVHGRMVAKGCMGAAAQLPVFLRAHSFTRCRTSYPTLPLFSVFRKLIHPSDIFEVKIWSLGALESNLAKSCYF